MADVTMLRVVSSRAATTSGCTRASAAAPCRPRSSARAAAAADALSWSSGSFAQGSAGSSHFMVTSSAARPRPASGQLLVVAEMFDGLSANLSKAWSKLKSESQLTEKNIKEPMKEIRRALLEADVSLPVVRRFVKKVEENAVGVQVTSGVTPDQQLVKVVADELCQLMGGVRGADSPIDFAADKPTVILMAGLQGVGKTTACGKLALYLKNSGRKVLMVATDVYRPAAIEQLEMLGVKCDVPVFQMGTGAKPEDIAAAGVAKARAEGFDTVIVDTAGRLTIDEEMMTELKAVKASTQASETLLVVDAMTGQEAATLTDAFNKAVDITGAVLTKMDGDSRGGAALSVREVSGKPIKFMGTGEKLEALEPFYPERMTSRILGMGDIVSLVEKAQRSVKNEEAAEIQRRLMEAQFDFNDFLKQAEMVSGMGSMQQLMKMLPGMSGVTDRQLAEAEKSFTTSKSLIQSMTAEERVKPELVAKSASRRRRIARGAGRSDTEISNLVDVFASMRARMQDMSRLMRIAGGKVNQMSADEMSSMVGAKKRIHKGKVRRYKEAELRVVASEEERAAAQAAVAAGVVAPVLDKAKAEGEGAAAAAGEQAKEPAGAAN